MYYLCAACGGSPTVANKDLRGSGIHDLSVDLSKQDMTAPPDMGLNVKVTGLPTDCGGTVNADFLWNTVVLGRCAISDCHGGATARYYRIDSAAEMSAKWIGQPSLGFGSMNFITAGSVDQSYIMYKVTNQQLSVVSAQNGGAQMPLNNAPLNHDELCTFIQWITQGAK